MSDEFYENLENAISSERLSHYIGTFNTTDKKAIITKYLLNIEVSKSFYLSLQNLEITLRNNIHSTLTNELNDSYWFDKPSFLMNPSFEKIQDAKRKINKEITSGRVISELSFGFWCTLFSRPYDQKIWNKYTKLIFPNIPKKFATRKILMKKINNIRKFRNKIFHFDTIIDLKNLHALHNEILELISWLNTDMHRLTLEFDKFEDIYNNQEKVIKEKLSNLIGENI